MAWRTEQGRPRHLFSALEASKHACKHDVCLSGQCGRGSEPDDLLFDLTRLFGRCGTGPGGAWMRMCCQPLAYSLSLGPGTGTARGPASFACQLDLAGGRRCWDVVPG